jgi:hypothetical protein
MISRYPRFSKLNLSHKSDVRAITRLFPPYSDFNFVSLYAWNTDNQTRLSVLNDNLVIQLADYMTNEITYSILGKEKIGDSLQKLFSLTNELRLVPETVIDSIQDQSRYDIVEDKDSFDYVYSLRKLVAMEGAGYKNKRKKIRRFTKRYSDLVKVTHRRSIDSDNKDELKQFFSKWIIENNKDEKEFLMEREAISRSLDEFRNLNLLLTEMRVDNRLIAFSIHEVLGNHALCHFEKELLSYENCSHYLIDQNSRHLSMKGCAYVNWEQDLGLPGLRENKQYYRPDKYLKKYTVRLK